MENFVFSKKIYIFAKILKTYDYRVQRIYNL